MKQLIKQINKEDPEFFKCAGLTVIAMFMLYFVVTIFA